MSESVCILVVAPGLEALIVTCEFPAAVPEEAVTTKVTDAGFPAVGLTTGG